MLTKLQLIAALSALAFPAAARLTEAAPESQLFAGLADACKTAKVDMAAVLAAAVTPTADADIKKLVEAAKTPEPAAGTQRVTEGAAVMTLAEFEARTRLTEARAHARLAVPLDRTRAIASLVWLADSGVADALAQYLVKGTSLYVEGRLNTRTWDDDGGQRHYRTEIVVNTVQLLGGRGGGEPITEPHTRKGNAASAADAGDDLPFN